MQLNLSSTHHIDFHWRSLHWLMRVVVTVVAVLFVVASAAAEEPTPDTSAQPSSAPVQESPQSDVSDVFSYIAAEEKTLVSVGATRATTIRESPGSVWVIDERTIRTSAKFSVYDILRRMPGTMPQERSFGQTEFYLRFAGSFPEIQTLIMIDGRTVTTDVFGFFNRNLIDVRSVERIEIVFGPASTLYGPNAFSGVINFVTRAPSRTGFHMYADGFGGVASGSPIDPPNHLRLGAIAGGYSEMSYGWGTGGIKVDASGQYAPGFGSVGEARIPTAVPHRRFAGNLDLVQDVRGWELRLKGGGAWMKSEMELIDVGPTTTQSHYVSGTATKKKLLGNDDELKLAITGAYNALSYVDAPIGGLPTLSSLRLEFYSLELHARYAAPIFYRNSLTGGAFFRGNMYFGNAVLNSGSNTLFSAGLFVEDTYRPIDALILTAGLRVDTREQPGTAAFRLLSFSPRASIVWLVNDRHTLRAEYASAFRTPALLETSISARSAAGDLVMQGNPNLENERVHAWSLSWLGRFKWFSPRIEVYVARTLNNVSPYFIQNGSSPTATPAGDPLYDPPSNTSKLPYYYHNIHEGFWIPGAVAEGNFEPVKNWRAFVWYSLTPVHYMHSVGLGQSLELERFMFSTQVYFYDQARTDHYDAVARLHVNLKVGVALDARKRWWMSAEAVNLFDARWFFDRRPGLPGYISDVITGTRLGPRAWVSLQYKM